jgi:RHH-type rel operon transcriptional repressor/antitoxin RelB
MLNVRLSEGLENRLKTVAQKTHRTKTYYVEEALKAYLDAYERDLLVIADYEEQVRNGTLVTYSLDEIKKKLGLSDHDLAD